MLAGLWTSTTCLPCLWHTLTRVFQQRGSFCPASCPLPMPVLRACTPTRVVWCGVMVWPRLPGHVDVAAQGTRVLPVFVISLQRPLDSLTFDNGQQVVATKDMVIVLQLLGKVRGWRPGAQAGMVPGSASRRCIPADKGRRAWAAMSCHATNPDEACLWPAARPKSRVALGMGMRTTRLA